MQVSILNGIYTDSSSDFRVSFPINLKPIPKQTGFSAGYLAQADGIVLFGEGTAVDRGGINWNGDMYRVMGTKLVRVSPTGVVETIGDVGGEGQVRMTFSFDYLAIASSTKLWLYNGTSLTQVTDVDLGNVIDFVWIDGYFLATDGEYIVSTELTDPFSVLTTKYASSEVSPDNLVSLAKIHNELLAVNRYTIEFFSNIGGTGFPFQRVNGAHIERGSVGTFTSAPFMGTLAFMGGGVNEAIGIYLASSATSIKISTNDIDKILSGYSETDLSTALVESRTVDSHEYLYIHLSDQTIVYDGGASKAFGTPVWFILKGINGKYPGRNFVYAYGKWLCGNPDNYKIGYLDGSTSEQFGEIIEWEFSTGILYNEGRGAIVHEIELVALTGNSKFGTDPQIETSYSEDGLTWSQEFYIGAGAFGDRQTRLAWIRQGVIRNWRIQKFKGNSDAHISIARLDVRAEPLVN